jgi:diguanylate cyclase (GGDEF)-like protein/PAS domain S-box-containing protein
MVWSARNRCRDDVVLPTVVHAGPPDAPRSPPRCCVNSSRQTPRLFVVLWCVLVLLPVVVALVLLAGAGVFAPHLIAPGIALTTLFRATLVVGGMVVGALALAVVRSRPETRASWAALAVAATAWTGSLIGAIRSWDSLLAWGLLRGVAVTALVVGLLLSPGVRRTAREWRLLLLDGWLVGVSVLLIGWVALRLTGSPLDHADLRPLAWVPVDLLLASMVVGLAGRSSARVRLPVVLFVLASLLTVTSDSTWALTGEPRFAVVEWLIMLWALGSTTLVRGPDVWVGDRVEPKPGEAAHPRITRLSQIAFVPGVLTAAVPGADLVTFTAAAGLIVGVVAELVLVQRQHRELWQALDLQARRLDRLFRESRDAILQVDRRGRVEFANDAVADVLGYDPVALLGRSGLALVHPEDRVSVVSGLRACRPSDPGGTRVTGRLRHSDGAWRHMESTVSPRTGADQGYTLSIRDVSERNRLEAELRRLASTDALTGLLNRRAFLTMLAERVPRGDISVLFIDLDGFKAVNDSAGHEAGDRVLRRVAEVLRAELRSGDIAARLGGDEFAVLPAVRAQDEALVLASRLVEQFSAALSTPFIPVGASIGVATGRHIPAEVLLRRADQAMYQAKASGGGRLCVHDAHAGDGIVPSAVGR